MTLFFCLENEDDEDENNVARGTSENFLDDTSIAGRGDDRNDKDGVGVLQFPNIRTPTHLTFFFRIHVSSCISHFFVLYIPLL